MTVVVVLVAVVPAVGCGGKATSGKTETTAPAKSGAEEVTVAQIANSPAEYDNRTVTTEGNYAVGYCSACFLLKDGVSAVRVEVSDTAPLPPESKLRSRMRVTGKIYVANGSPNIVADRIDYL